MDVDEIVRRSESVVSSTLGPKYSGNMSASVVIESVCWVHRKAYDRSRQSWGRRCRNMAVVLLGVQDDSGLVSQNGAMEPRNMDRM